MVAKTVRGVSLGLGAEVLHEELLKCIIKSNLEQKILEHTQNQNKAICSKLAIIKNGYLLTILHVLCYFIVYNSLMITSQYLRPYLEEEAKTSECSWLLRVTVMIGKHGFELVSSGSRAGNLNHFAAQQCLLWCGNIRYLCAPKGTRNRDD